MGSINVIKKTLFLFIFFLSFSHVFGQSDPSVSLASVISGLEKITLGSASRERYNAFFDLLRLQLLSGDTESAFKTCESALVIFPDDGRLLLEQARLLLSQGEYEKAAAVINTLLKNDKDRELFNQGRYLAAQLVAFRSGDTQALAALAEDPDFAGYRSGIYYTLWKLTDLPSWKTRLTAEFPRSPEAIIAGSDSAMALASTPLWLLYPGRNSIVLGAPTVLPAVQSSAAQTSAAPSAQEQPPAFLQTGLFGREENARAMGENLKKAGFEPRITRRSVNGNEYWAVSVGAGRDMNATIMKLKDAGFEAFPVANP